jgi:Flp pilus assembly protein CpaB
MSRNLRIFIILALIVVIGGVAAAFLLFSGEEDNGGEPPTQDPNAVVEPADEEDSEPGQPTLTPFPTQELTTAVILVQTVNRGQEIPLDAIELRAWPLDSLPFDAVPIGEQLNDDGEVIGVVELADYAGRIARTDLYPEQPLINAYLAPSREDLAAQGSDIATIIPDGEVAISIPVDRLTSVAYALRPGDRVDLSVALLYVDIDEEFQSKLPNAENIVSYTEGGFTIGPDLAGRFEQRQQVFPDLVDPRQSFTVNFTVIEKPREEPRPRLVTQRTVQDAQVLWVGNFPELGQDIFDPTPTQVQLSVEEEANQQQQPANSQQTVEITSSRPDLVTISVTPQEALVLQWFIEAGTPLNFLLRSASDNSRIITDAVTLEYIMETYEITVPPTRDYSIEPAIRDIRNVTIGNLEPITNTAGVTVTTQGNANNNEGN